MGTSAFDKLLAWQQARTLTRDMYAVTRGQRFTEDPDLARQLRRSAVAIMTNIAEGYGRHNQAEFQQYLVSACSAAAAVRSYVYVAWDAGYLTEAIAKRLLEQTESVGRLTDGLRIAISDRAHLEQVAPRRQVGSQLHGGSAQPQGSPSQRDMLHVGT